MGHVKTTKGLSTSRRHNRPAVRPSAVSVRVLDLAERVTTLVEADVWTRETMPSQEEIQRRLRAGRETIAETFDLLVARNILRLYYDPTVCRLPRYLPAHVAAEHEVRWRIDDIAEEVELCLQNGVWTTETFPSITGFSRMFRCRTTTVSEVMSRLATLGLVRRTKVGRSWKWAPTNHSDQDEPPLYERTLLDILWGRWTAALPTAVELAGIYRSSPSSILRLCRQLAAAGLIRDRRRPGRQRAVWHVNDGAIDYETVHHNAAVIASDILGTMTAPLQALPGDVIDQCAPLPTELQLAQAYRCSPLTIKIALAMLVHQGVLERDPANPDQRRLLYPAGSFEARRRELCSAR